ncbi:hypothetical protein [Mesorhizobium sp.]|uniref:hypothetical protein n=2 Tax=Mesorhizobium sp. TaxID=1871066 RepID=UPI00257ABCE7|nr:hypothetical protein [Mesorhizobium sp.]
MDADRFPIGGLPLLPRWLRPAGIFLFSGLLQKETSGLPVRSPPKGLIMSEDAGKGSPGAGSAREALAHYLAEQTGISEADARVLIELIGTNWNSLIREARVLKPRR